MPYGTNHYSYKCNIFQILRLTQLINTSDSINKSMTTIIKSYISRQVAIQYVPCQTSKVDGSKSIFKITKFYECIAGMFFFLFKNNAIMTFNFYLIFI